MEFSITPWRRFGLLLVGFVAGLPMGVGIAFLPDLLPADVIHKLNPFLYWGIAGLAVWIGTAVAVRRRFWIAAGFTFGAGLVPLFLLLLIGTLGGHLRG